MPNPEHVEREHGIDSHQRIKTFQRMMYGLVAKDIPRKMWGSVQGAQEAVDKEWRRLRDQDVWDEDNPRGLWDVIDEAKRLNKQIHIGRLFDICVEKSSELEHKKRKYPWYRDTAPCMLTKEQQKVERDKRSVSGEAAPDDDAYSDGACPY